ncbi:glutamate decarboxylase 1 isoform X4 [Cyclopterus lumpus]|uniref:glutamate decarboxylase 1 isoform X4 n=1 Tax=Cyclopterus lumpus TaxID=8103 RepID=UPI0014871F93|nr:glutamate decarboxylase 1 isoform X4 [Cyclopterus lumpus]
MLYRLDIVPPSGNSRIIGRTAGRNKEHDLAAVKDRGKTPADFSRNYSKDLLPAPGGEELTRGFLQEVVDILLGYISKSSQRSSKVLDFHHPHQLKEGLECFSLDLPDQPETLEQILVDCRDTLKYGVRTGHPRFLNQLSSGLDVVGVAGEWLTSTANTNMFTYEVSPVFVLMEECLLKKMQSILGWSDDVGDGIFCPGGTISNLYSILVARYHFYPEVKTRGMGVLPQLALFTSEQSHYSVKKSAAVLGMGSENVFMVKCDESGKMIPAELESSIVTAKEKALVPFYVNATAGTTVYGAFDPLNAIADICQRYTLWMHVDGLLQECNDFGAEYLFQTDKNYDVSYDTGDKSIQCGRHVDVFKLWLMWKAKGSEGFGSQVNKCLENAEYLYDQLQRRTDFELVLKNKDICPPPLTQPEHSNVCFWYIPPSLRGQPPGPDRDARLHQVAPRIKGRMMEKGSVMIGYQPLGDKVNFFRCVFSNPATQQEDIDFLLDEITRLGDI